MTDESEYVDYDLYLDPNFSPLAFANSLVQATNNPTDNDVDLEAPNKRLAYDMEEVDKLVNSIAGENHEQLLHQASQVDTAREALEPLQKSLEHVNYSYGKLSQDVLRPYDKAQTVYTALRRLHMTSSILRQLTWYLYLARQLDSQGPDGYSSVTPDTCYDVALVVKQCRDQLAKHQALNSLQIIKEHQKVLSQKEQKVREQALYILQNLSLKSTENNRSRISRACLALFQLDPQLMVSTVADTIPRKVKESSAQMKKSLVALPQAFFNAAQDARDRAQTLKLLIEVLESTEQEQVPLITVVNTTRTDFPAKENVLARYWRDVASDFDSQLRDYLRRNEPAARSRKKLIPQLKESITNAVVESGVDSSSPAVKVMVNCFAAWDRL